MFAGGAAVPKSKKKMASHLSWKHVSEMNRIVLLGVHFSEHLSSVEASYCVLGFPGGSVGKESACQCRTRGFSPWVGKIPWRRKWQPTLVFLPGEPLCTEEPAGL